MTNKDAIQVLKDIEILKFRDVKEAYTFKCVKEAIDTAIEALSESQIIRCKDCKYRIVNEHYGEKGYMDLKAMCDLDTGDPFELGRNAEDDDWFCADAERKEE